MRFGFVTCVQLGLSCMEAIYEAGGALELIMTLPNDMALQKAGRVFVDDFARRHGVPVAKVHNINDSDALEALHEADLDWLFIIGWSQIARSEVLAIPRKGVIGIHPTLLPQGRGRAAIPWAILKGLPKTGVTLFQLNEGVDTGPIFLQREIALKDRIDAGELYALVDAAHVGLVREAFPLLAHDEIIPAPQAESQASEWPGRRPEDGRINLAGTVAEADRLVRAVTRPYPGAFYEENGLRTIVWRAEPCTCEYSGPDRVLRLSDGNLRILDSETVP